MSDKSTLAYFVAGALVAVCHTRLTELGLHAVPELVDGVVTGRLWIDDAVGQRRLVIDVCDLAPDA